jgi:hypothetical protein
MLIANILLVDKADLIWIFSFGSQWFYYEFRQFDGEFST